MMYCILFFFSFTVYRRKTVTLHKCNIKILTPFLIYDQAKHFNAVSLCHLCETILSCEKTLFVAQKVKLIQNLANNTTTDFT